MIESTKRKGYEHLTEEYIRLTYLDIPSHLVDGLLRFIHQKIRPGSFLVGILANDLHTTISHAHPTISIKDITELCRFVQLELNGIAGSWEEFDQYLKGK